MILEAIPFHIEGLIEDCDPVPEPSMSISDAMAYHITLEVEETVYEQSAYTSLRPLSGWWKSK